jgi:MFS family permease
MENIEFLLENHNYWARKFQGFKWFIFVDYAINMISSVFNNLWFSANGMSLSQLYLYNFLGLVFAGIFQNYVSILSDKINRRYPFLIIGHIVQALAMFAVVWGPNLWTFIFFVFAMNFISNETFRVVMAYKFMELSIDPNIPIKKYNPFKEFSKFRVYGSIGFAVAGPIVGYAINQINVINNLSPVNGLLGYQILFSICGVSNLIFIILLTVYLRTYTKMEIQIQPKSKNTFREALNEHPVRKLFKNRYFVEIIISQTIFWFSYNICLALIDIFFKGLGANLIFIGWRPFFWAIAEFPMFFLSAYIAKKYSYFPTLIIAYQFLTLKLIIYYYFMTPSLIWVDLGLQLLTSFGISYPAITTAFNDMFPNQKSLAIGTFSTIKSVSMMGGAIIGWLVASVISSPQMAFLQLFLISLIINIGNSILVFILHYWAKNEKKN